MFHIASKRPLPPLPDLGQAVNGPAPALCGQRIDHYQFGEHRLTHFSFVRDWPAARGKIVSVSRVEWGCPYLSDAIA